MFFIIFASLKVPGVHSMWAVPTEQRTGRIGLAVSVNVHSYYVDRRTAVFMNGSANQEASDVHPMGIQVEKRSYEPAFVSIFPQA